jgi:sulfite reductase (NADPH) flavoprotein alpha-component
MSNLFGLLNDKQQQLVGDLTSGLQRDQLLWLSGYLAGLGEASGERPVAAVAGTQQVPLTILFGTHTGHSEALANQLAEKASVLGIDVEVTVMEDYDVQELPDAGNLLVIVSTDGEGEPPLNALDFLEYLQGERCRELPGLNYAVLALGDRSYKQFCQTGIDFDTALEGKGANRLLELVKCDVDYHEDARQWSDDVLDILQQQKGTVSDVSVTASGPLTSAVAYDRQHPFGAKVLDKIKLSGRGSGKEVYHLELLLRDSGLTYEPGDTVGIFCDNPPELVEKVLEITGFDCNEPVTVKDGTHPLETVLRHHLELSVLNRSVLESYRELSGNEILADLLNDEQALDTYLYGHDVVDLLTDFPAELDVTGLISVLTPLQPRMYSISSSQAAHPEELHLTVAAVRYDNHDRRRHGACSTFLSDRVEPGSEIPIFIEKNRNFKLPEQTEAPLIMVGAGTGIAPYRSFVQHRQKLKVNGDSWLFFGDRQFYTDFLYQAEWQKFLKKGSLGQLTVAFSRDQEEKLYVQHRMREHSRQLYEWLQRGAYFYVCGDKNQMAKDVHQTLLEIVAAEGGMTPEKADEYLKELKKQRRYQLDVY